MTARTSDGKAFKILTILDEYTRECLARENGYIESFNGKLRDELLNRGIFSTLAEAMVLIADWRKEYNQVRPHSSLGYRPPAPEAKILVTLTQ